MAEQSVLGRHTRVLRLSISVRVRLDMGVLTHAARNGRGSGTLYLLQNGAKGWVGS